MSTRNDHREYLANMTDDELHKECVRRWKLAADERRRMSRDRPQSERDQLCYQECGSRGRPDIYEAATYEALAQLTAENKAREGRS